RLVTARASFMLGQFDAAADAAAAARPTAGELLPYAAKLQGESLLLAGRPADALEPLRTAAAAHPDGPARFPASALPGDLLRRAQRLLSAGQPGWAVAQAEAASNVLHGEDLAEAQLVLARSLAADGRRSDAAPALTAAWKRGSPHVAASAGLLLARDRA